MTRFKLGEQFIYRKEIITVVKLNKDTVEFKSESSKVYDVPYNDAIGRLLNVKP